MQYVENMFLVSICIPVHFLKGSINCGGWKGWLCLQPLTIYMNKDGAFLKNTSSHLQDCCSNNCRWNHPCFVIVLTNLVIFQYAHGRFRASWRRGSFFGLLEVNRRWRRLLLKFVCRRNAEQLLPIIQWYIRPANTILSDSLPQTETTWVYTLSSQAITLNIWPHITLLHKFQSNITQIYTLVLLWYLHDITQFLPLHYRNITPLLPSYYHAVM